MADPNPDAPISDELLERLAKVIAEQVVSLNTFGLVQRAGTNSTQEALSTLVGVVLALAGTAGAYLAKNLIDGEDLAEPAYRELLAAAVKDVTGADISGQLSARPGDRSAREGAGRVVGRALLDALTGATGGSSGGTLEPSTAPAEKYMTFITQMALEGWLQGVIGELVSLGAVENLGDLDDTLANVLGLSRLTRRVVGPLLNARVVLPMEWHVNKTYRPQLLSASEVARQVARGRMTTPEGIEELARQGYSDKRIEAVLNTARRFHSLADLDLLVRAGQISRPTAVQHLRDQGWDEATADTELRLEQLRRIASFERELARAAVNAYVDRQIDRAQLVGLVDGNTLDPQERAQLLELADTRRQMNTRGLSAGEARAAAMAQIIAVRDYVDVLEVEGYDDRSVLVLELLLRHELDKAADIEELRRRQAIEREQRERERQEAAEQRRREVDAARALARRGSEADLERAVVRGLISSDRYAEVIRPNYDSDTVDIMLRLADAARQEYIARQAAAEEAKRRAQARGLDIGSLQTAVLEGVLSVDQFSNHPALSTLSAGDRAILVATLRERLEDRQRADDTREAAERAARNKSIDLGRFEQLVRRGVRSLAQYDALLRELGLGEAARADMRQLLQLKIADDDAARRARDDAERQAQNKGLSVEQFRRAVILGQKAPADFEAFLVSQGYTADVQRLLLAELADVIDEADAARARRAEADRVRASTRLPLSTVRQAARLGVISPDAYDERLRLEGYSDDDRAIERELLIFEITDVQLRRASGTALDPELVGDEQRLGDELARRRDELLARDEPRALSLGQLEQALKAGAISPDDFYQGAIGLGYAADDAELLTALAIDRMG